MQLMTRPWFVFAYVALLIAIIGWSLSFYWNDWRPYKVKSECAKLAGKETLKGEAFDILSPLKDGAVENYQLLYTHCLRSKGL
jgi:hypothetical protein